MLQATNTVPVKLQQLPREKEGSGVKTVGFYKAPGVEVTPNYEALIRILSGHSPVISIDQLWK